MSSSAYVSAILRIARTSSTKLKAIVVITVRAYYFHDYIYITPILLLWNLSTLCVADHLWPLILRSFVAYWVLFGPAMCNRTSYAQVHDLPQNHSRINLESRLFSRLHIYYYIKAILLLRDLQTLCLSWITYDLLHSICSLFRWMYTRCMYIWSIRLPLVSLLPFFGYQLYYLLSVYSFILFVITDVTKFIILLIIIYFSHLLYS